jgi:hypothetical protein
MRSSLRLKSSNSHPNNSNNSLVPPSSSNNNNNIFFFFLYRHIQRGTQVLRCYTQGNFLTYLNSEYGVS